MKLLSFIFTIKLLGQINIYKCYKNFIKIGYIFSFGKNVFGEKKILHFLPFSDSWLQQRSKLTRNIPFVLFLTFIKESILIKKG